MFLHQTNYIQSVLKNFVMNDVKTISVPANPHTLIKRDDEVNKLVNIPYREAIGSLMFLSLV